MSGKNDMFFLNGMLITSNNSIDSRYWDIAKHKILQQEVLWYSTVTVLSTWQDELVSCAEAIYCWCRCWFMNFYHTQNLSIPLFPYTKCRISPELFCNHCITIINCPWNRESAPLQFLPIQAVLLPRFEIILTLNVVPWALFADLCLKFSCLNILRYVWNISPLPIKGQGARLPKPSANHTSPNITDIAMPPLNM